ncbi:MAG TPA: hypothetical protein VI688_02695, partial [Anaerolineales bacterium]|nr:hypothetical protein [Anaerolineales bacterium]
RLPWASQSLAAFPFILVLAWYGALAVLTFRPLRQQLKQIRPRPAVALGMLAALCLWTWSAALAAPDGTLQLTLLDGGGEAILIRTPSGRTILIDAGPSLTKLTDELRRELSFGERLDWLLLAGSQREQIGALATGLERVSPRALAWAVSSEQVDAVLEQSNAGGIAATELHAGDVFDLGLNGKLEVVAVGARGAVLLVEWEQFSALLPVGLDLDLMRDMDASLALPPIDVLLLADGGNPALSPSDWLADLAPQIVWVAVGGELPEETQFALQGYRVLATSQVGWSRINSDGENIWVEVNSP